MLIKNKIEDFKTIVGLLKNSKEGRVLIQTHNFPDADAIATAHGLQNLFVHFEITSYLIYDGNIERNVLKKIVDDLEVHINSIDVFNKKYLPINQSDKIIIVDACKGNKNVTDLLGKEIAVIDHHYTVSPDDVEYIDIRPEYGSCSTIIYEYFKHFSVPIASSVATLFLAGLLTDTLSLTRGVIEQDIKCYLDCMQLGNLEYANSIIRNSTKLGDLWHYNFLIKNLYICDNIAFCYFPSGCDQNLLGILADFILALIEIDFVLLAAHNTKKINLSVRSEVPEWDASQVIQQIIKDIGFGGGHTDMAGGVIVKIESFDVVELQTSMLQILNISSFELKKYQYKN